MTTPELVAHRGYAARYPENTLPALAAAIAAGARHLEIDVQLARDGVPMVFHDENLVRMTGQEGCVFQRGAAELAQLPCFYPEPQAGAPVARIPRLSEFVALLQQHPQVTAYVEIKEESLDVFGVEATVRAAIAEVSRAAAQVVLISFHLGALEAARAQGWRRVGWVLHRWDEPSRLAALRVEPEFLICNYTKIQARPGAMWPGPWAWMLYEVIDPRLARDLAGLGARYIETMRIVPMLQALA